MVTWYQHVMMKTTLLSAQFIPATSVVGRVAMMALDMNFSSPKTFFLLRSPFRSSPHLRYSKSFHLRFASLKKVSFSKRGKIQIKCHQEELEVVSRKFC